jgi:hypothetical protein
LFDAGAIVKGDAVAIGQAFAGEENDGWDAGGFEAGEGFGHFEMGVVREEDAIDAAFGQLAEVEFLEMGLVAGIAEQDLIALLEGGVFDGFGDFGEEAVANVRENQSHDFPREAGGIVAVGIGYQGATARLVFESSVVYQWLNRTAEGEAGDAEFGRQKAFGGQKGAPGKYSFFNAFAEDLGDLLAFHSR